MQLNYSDFNDCTGTCAIVDHLLAQYTVRCGSAGVSYARSRLANTNQVYLVIPNSKHPPFILRITGQQHHDMIDMSDRVNHEKMEMGVLHFLRKNQCSFVPEILPNDNGQTITLGPQGERCCAFSYKMGKTIGNFNQLSAFNISQRTEFFSCVGELSRKLSQYTAKFFSKEKNLTQLNSIGLQRFKVIIGKLEQMSNSDGRILIYDYKNIIEQFIESLSFPERILAQTKSQLCHFDIHLGNVLFDGDMVSALLDWDWCRLAEWYGVDWVSSIAMCCYQYDTNGGSQDGVYSQDQIQHALSHLRKSFGDKGRLLLDDENALLVETMKSYVCAQFLFTCEHYLAEPSDHSRFVDMRHFLYLIVKNNFAELIYG